MSNSMNIESIEQGTQSAGTSISIRNAINWPLTMISCSLMSIGAIGGPLLQRLYYLHGGQCRWLTSCMQTAGFPILLFPLGFLYFHARTQGISPLSFFMEPKLFLFSGAAGLLIGLDNFLYSLGLSYLPVSTSSILFSTQIAFIAVFAWIIVKQRFTPFSINSVVLLTLASVVLGLRTNGDRPPSVSNAQYLLGFFMTLVSAALAGLLLPCIELSYAKSTKPVTYSIVVQFQISLAIVATIFSTMGMLINKDFQAMGREATAYGLGHKMYYTVVFASAVMWQLCALGGLGVVLYMSSLFSGIMTGVLLPITAVASVIAYHESFNGEKGMSLALCIWGFVSYFYGEYKMNKKKTYTTQEQVIDPCTK